MYFHDEHVAHPPCHLDSRNERTQQANAEAHQQESNVSSGHWRRLRIHSIAISAEDRNDVAAIERDGAAAGESRIGFVVIGEFVWPGCSGRPALPQRNQKTLHGSDGGVRAGAFGVAKIVPGLETGFAQIGHDYEKQEWLVVEYRAFEENNQQEEAQSQHGHKRLPV